MDPHPVQIVSYPETSEESHRDRDLQGDRATSFDRKVSTFNRVETYGFQGTSVTRQWMAATWAG